MHVIVCYPPQQLEYLVGDITIRFLIENRYDEAKECVVVLLDCDNYSDCSRYDIAGQSEEFELPPGGPYEVKLHMRINEPGYYGIVVYNLTDDQAECGFVIHVTTQREQMMNAMMAMMPVMFAIPIVGVMVRTVSEITEKMR